MIKKISIAFLTLGLVLSISPLFAEEEESFKRKTEGPIVFFSDKVPRYEGFAVSGFLSNEYALGVWSNFAVSNLALGGDVEYTFPHFLPLNMDLGAAFHVDYGITIPKWGTTLRSHSDFRIYGSAYLRVPFRFLRLNFALQPELGYGVAINHCVGQNGSKVKGWFADQYISFAPELRFSVPIPVSKMEELKWMQDIEFGFAPVWNIAPELSGTYVQNLGWRAGITWHVEDTIKDILRKQESKKLAALAAAQEAENKRLQEEALEKQRKLEEEERRKREALQAAADAEEKARLEAELKAAEEERKRQEEELARLAEEARIAAEKEAARLAEEKLREDMRSEFKKSSFTSNYMIGIDTDQLADFSPDGDGVNDSLVFKPNLGYLSNPPESWQILVSDPVGNVFKIFEAKNSYPPETIEWDGKGDDGSTVFSHESYNIKMTVKVSEKDYERLGITAEKATITGETEVQVGIVLKQTTDNEWRIEMASITFDPNAATFNKLSKAKKTELYNSLDEIAEKAKTMGNISIKIEGYANNVSGTDKENTEELIPLSQARAEAIANLLIERGLCPDVVKAEGLGGANPKASREDRENWWKNRRIEFVFSK